MSDIPLIMKPPFSALITTITNVVQQDVITMSALIVQNLTGAQSYLQIFNVASESVVLGTTVAYATIPLPSGGGTGVDTRWKIGLPGGGCSMVATTIATGTTVANAYVFALFE